MDRNYRNFIKWKKEDGEKIELSLKQEEINTEEVQALFDTSISSELVEESGKVVFDNASVQISGVGMEQKTIINLDVNSLPPYTLKKNGEVLDQDLVKSDFPYVDEAFSQKTFVTPAQNFSAKKEVLYEIKSRKSTSDSTTVTVTV